MSKGRKDCINIVSVCGNNFCSFTQMYLSLAEDPAEVHSVCVFYLTGKDYRLKSQLIPKGCNIFIYQPSLSGAVACESI